MLLPDPRVPPEQLVAKPGTPLPMVTFRLVFQYSAYPAGLFETTPNLLCDAVDDRDACAVPTLPPRPFGNPAAAVARDGAAATKKGRGRRPEEGGGD